MKGLIVKSPWIDKILSGEKPWEIRGSNTKIRGKIALIESGTGMIYGTVELIGVKNMTMWELCEHTNKHCIYNLSIITYRQPKAWIMQNPVRLKRPVPYKHPRGAVVWINLPDDILTSAIEATNAKWTFTENHLVIPSNQ